MVAASGDSMISRKISVCKEFEQIAEIIRKADVGFSNCEMLFHKCESYPMPRVLAPERTMMYAEPIMAKELAWAGFRLASLSNTHTMDYGPLGMFSTMKALDDAGIVYAGVGRDLDEAREPKYLELENGRVALLSSCWDDTLNDPWERASNMKAGVPARPGINLLQVETQHIVSRARIDALKAMIIEAGLDPPSGEKAESEENEVTFLGHKFKAGDRPGTYRTVKKRDLEETIMSVKDAKRSADWVFVSLHSHTSAARGAEFPPDFMCHYARECIDAGADTFLGHGPHILRGIELYRGKPIFYSLGNFIMHNLTVKKVTYDQYDFLGLSQDSKPSDFYDTRVGKIPPSEPPYRRWWFESVVALFELTENALAELTLYPIMLGLDDSSRSRMGNPRLAQGEQSRAIIEHLSQISSEWSTEIRFDKGLGKVALN